MNKIPYFRVRAGNGRVGSVEATIEGRIEDLIEDLIDDVA